MRKMLGTVALVALLSGCAAWDRACEQVADVDDQYAQAMAQLRLLGLIDMCEMDCAEMAPGESVERCQTIRARACEAKTAVLSAQSGIYTAYRLCYEDESP